MHPLPFSPPFSQYQFPHYSFFGVSGDTLLTTRDQGQVAISTLDEQIAEIWNGTAWEQALVGIAGHDQSLYLVTLSSGQTLTCSGAYNWYQKVAKRWTFKGIKTSLTDHAVGNWRTQTETDPNGSESGYPTIVSVAPLNTVDTIYYVASTTKLTLFNGILASSGTPPEGDDAGTTPPPPPDSDLGPLLASDRSEELDDNGHVLWLGRLTKATPMALVLSQDTADNGYLNDPYVNFAVPGNATNVTITFTDNDNTDFANNSGWLMVRRGSVGSSYDVDSVDVNESDNDGVNDQSAGYYDWAAMEFPFVVTVNSSFVADTGMGGEWFAAFDVDAGMDGISIVVDWTEGDAPETRELDANTLLGTLNDGEDFAFTIASAGSDPATNEPTLYVWSVDVPDGFVMNVLLEDNANGEIALANADNSQAIGLVIYTTNPLMDFNGYLDGDFDDVMPLHLETVTGAGGAGSSSPEFVAMLQPAFDPPPGSGDTTTYYITVGTVASQAIANVRLLVAILPASYTASNGNQGGGGPSETSLDNYVALTSIGLGSTLTATIGGDTPFDNAFLNAEATYPAQYLEYYYTNGQGNSSPYNAYANVNTYGEYSGMASLTTNLLTCECSAMVGFCPCYTTAFQLDGNHYYLDSPSLFGVNEFWQEGEQLYTYAYETYNVSATRVNTESPYQVTSVQAYQQVSLVASNVSQLSKFGGYSGSNSFSFPEPLFVSFYTMVENSAGTLMGCAYLGLSGVDYEGSGAAVATYNAFNAWVPGSTNYLNTVAQDIVGRFDPDNPSGIEPTQADEGGTHWWNNALAIYLDTNQDSSDVNLVAGDNYVITAVQGAAGTEEGKLDEQTIASLTDALIQSGLATSWTDFSMDPPFETKLAQTVQYDTINFASYLYNYYQQYAREFTNSLGNGFDCLVLYSPPSFDSTEYDTGQLEVRWIYNVGIRPCYTYEGFADGQTSRGFDFEPVVFAQGTGTVIVECYETIEVNASRANTSSPWTVTSIVDSARVVVIDPVDREDGTSLFQRQGVNGGYPLIIEFHGVDTYTRNIPQMSYTELAFNSLLANDGTTATTDWTVSDTYIPGTSDPWEAYDNCVDYVENALNVTQNENLVPDDYYPWWQGIPYIFVCTDNPQEGGIGARFGAVPRVGGLFYIAMRISRPE